jgi:thiamine kinase-like enzyme
VRALPVVEADELGQHGPEVPLVHDDHVIQGHLVHSDLLHYNVLVAADRVTAVLDWGSSLYGDFLFDLAWLSTARWFRAQAMALSRVSACPSAQACRNAASPSNRRPDVSQPSRRRSSTGHVR